MHTRHSRQMTFLETSWTLAEAKATAVSAMISAWIEPRPPVTLLCQYTLHGAILNVTRIYGLNSGDMWSLLFVCRSLWQSFVLSVCKQDNSRILVLVRIQTWIYDQFISITNIRRRAFHTMYFHSAGGGTAAALGHNIFYTIYAHSPDGDTAAPWRSLHSLSTSCCLMSFVD